MSDTVASAAMWHRQAVVDLAAIFVTGAAGLLGGEIVAALAARGHRVIGLVRKNREIRFGAGQLLASEDWDGSIPEAGRVALVTGDVREPDLGLGRQAWRDLIDGCDSVIHCAAVVAFDSDDETYASVNVTGTANALRLAECADAGFVHVGTAYVCGERDGPIAENEPPGAKFANGYEASKARAEALVRDASAAGLNACIARPSIIVGREKDGVIAGFDAIYMAFRLLARGRLKTIPATADATLDFVAIDHVVKGIVTMAERIEAVAGEAVHLVSGQPMAARDFFALVSSYPQFADPDFVAPDDFDPDELSPIERRFHRRVATLYSCYFERNPLFLQDNAERLLGRPGPPSDAEFMRRQIDFAIRAGFLPAESVPA